MQFDKTSYLETFYEIVEAITIATMLSKVPKKLLEIQENQGRGGLYEFAIDLTDEFEKINEGRVWDGEFFDEIDEFVRRQIYTD